jgi:predicted ATPase
LKTGPYRTYQQLVNDGGYTADDAQLPAINALDNLWHQLHKKSTRPGGGNAGDPGRANR